MGGSRLWKISEALGQHCAHMQMMVIPNRWRIQRENTSKNALQITDWDAAGEILKDKRWPIEQSLYKHDNTMFENISAQCEFHFQIVTTCHGESEGGKRAGWSCRAHPIGSVCCEEWICRVRPVWFISCLWLHDQSRTATALSCYTLFEEM